MATLKETFSAQLHDLQADLDKYMEQSKTLDAENEELKEKGEMLSHDVRELWMLGEAYFECPSCLMICFQQHI